MRLNPTMETRYLSRKNRDELSGHIYRSPDGISILELNGYVEMLAILNDKIKNVDDLIKKCGNPSAETRAEDIRILSYGSRWSVLVKSGTVTELWVSKKN